MTTEMEASPIQELPDEILLNIFSNISKAELVNTIPQVCERWSVLYDDPSLFRKIKLDATSPDTETAIRWIEMAPWLTDLRISNRCDTDEILARLSDNSPYLETLSVTHCKGSFSRWDVSSQFLGNVIEHCPKLQHLSLDGTNVSSCAIHFTIALKSKLLKTVHFGEMTQHSISQVLHNLTENCQRLEELRMSHCAVTNISEEVIATFCRRFRGSLKVLQIEGYSWTDMSLKELEQCQALESLLLSDTNLVTCHGFHSIASLPHLVDLTVRKCRQMSKSAWVKFLETPNIEKLKRLGINKCKNIDDVVMKSVGEMVNLVELKVSHAPDVTCEGWRELFANPKMQNLTHVALCYCETLSEDVLGVIKENLGKLETFQHIQAYHAIADMEIE